MECHSHFLSGWVVHVGWSVQRETNDIRKAMTRYPKCLINNLLCKQVPSSERSGWQGFKQCVKREMSLWIDSGWSFLFIHVKMAGIITTSVHEHVRNDEDKWTLLLRTISCSAEEKKANKQNVNRTANESFFKWSLSVFCKFALYLTTSFGFSIAMSSVFHISLLYSTN